jgi:hypothetical protein
MKKWQQDEPGLTCGEESLDLGSKQTGRAALKLNRINPVGVKQGRRDDRLVQPRTEFAGDPAQAQRRARAGGNRCRRGSGTDSAGWSCA